MSLSRARGWDSRSAADWSATHWIHAQLVDWVWRRADTSIVEGPPAGKLTVVAAVGLAAVAVIGSTVTR